MAIALASLLASLGAQPDRDESALFAAGRWFDLRAITTSRSPALIQGAVAAAFNQRAHAEALLRSVIRSQPSPQTADDAYALLCRTYVLAGLYATFESTYREWGTALPRSKQHQEQRHTLEQFAGRPNQINERIRSAAVTHDRDSFTVPVTINGKSDEFLLDTGALHSVMTDREARKLGLTPGGDVRLMTGASGDTARFRTAIARQVVIGGTSFRNVSFAVMEPVGAWRDAEVGIVGVPLLLGLGAVRWSHDGTAQLGHIPAAAASETNLVIDRRILVKTEVLGQTALLALDTGASTTDLNANFATQFRSAVGGARKTTQDITGVGGTRTFDALELPEVAFRIGAKHVLLRPAPISLQRITTVGGECCVGNAGRDLLLQFASVTIDLGAMTLRLE